MDGEPTSEREQAWRLHGKVLAVLAALAAAATLVTSAFHIGGGGWFSLENLLLGAIWGAFAANALLTTVLVAMFAKQRATTLAIDLACPFVVFVLGLSWVGSQAVRQPAAAGNSPWTGPPEVVRAAAAECLTSIDRWSWSELDRFSARVELEVTTPGPATVDVSVCASDPTRTLDTPTQTTHQLPAGRSPLILELQRLQPGRPTSWDIQFTCVEPRALVRYMSGAKERPDGWTMIRALPAAAAEPRPTPPAHDYDLFMWSKYQPGFLLRRAAYEGIDPKWQDSDIKSPMEALPEQLARLGHATVILWPTPTPPEADQVTTVQAACRKAGVSLVMPPWVLSPPPERHDGAVAPASD